MKLNPLVKYENNSYYLGEWNPANNTRHGRGILVWEDKSKFRGYFKNDLANGKGKLEHQNGDYYDGEWKDDKIEGKGTFFHEDGSKYIGELGVIITS